MAVLLAGAGASAAEAPATSTPTQAPEAAKNSIESLDYSTLPGGKIVIKLGLKQPLANPPAGFAINNPPRIALDFPDTANALGKNAVTVGEGILRSLNVVQAGSRTRLVINLTAPAGYETHADGKNLVVTLQTAGVSTSTVNVAPRFAEGKAAAQKHSLRDVDFRRGKNGEGRIVIDLSDTSTGIDIRQQGKNLVVDFVDTSLPASLERRLDVMDFGTPVQAVSTFRQGNNVRMVIEPKGLWEHSAYQTDRRFTVEVKPVAEDPNKLVQGAKPGYAGEKLSLNFQNVEVRAVLQVIADFTGLNVITSETVSGNLTLRLKDVPWDQALDIILQSKGLSMRKNGSVVWIAPTDELATKEKLELEAKQQISELEPTRTESFQLKYQKAEAMQKIIGDDKQKILSKRGSVVVDARTNTLFVQDTPTRLEEIRKLIAQVDVPVRQVMIESRIVEASDKFSKALGARLGFHDQGLNSGFKIGGDPATVKAGGSLEDTMLHTGSPQLDSTVGMNQLLNVNLPAKITGATPGALALTLFRAGSSKFLNLELSALQVDGRGKIVSNPRVVTADQVEATIEQGTEIPYQQATSSGATSITFKKAVLSLKVKPQITPDDNIIMDLKVNKDSPDFDAATARIFGPPINTKQINTQVLVENGGTVVIGGIYQQDESKSISKVPLFGDIPVLGHLFKTTTTQDNKTELLIFVTPRILKESLNLR
jgi:type IV pilus assembly protein PilQ